MPVGKTLEQIRDCLSAEDQRQLLEFAEYLLWRQKQSMKTTPEDGSSVEDQEGLQAEHNAARFTLPNARLKDLATNDKPPQTWYDEDDKPV